MNKKYQVILVGATGDLGSRVLRALKSENATVLCLVRPQTSREKQTELAQFSTVKVVDFNDFEALTQAMKGGDVVLSTVSGLREVIVDFQLKLHDAAVKAGVTRFIPSDFAIDYRPIAEGENRNLGFRKELNLQLDQSPIQVTSILNGAFLDMITGVAPYIIFPIKKALSYGNSSQKMDFTLIDDVAKYTAKATLDPSTPRYLKIAGDELSAKDFAQIMTELTGQKHGVLRPGGLWLLKALIKMTKFFSPSPNETYPAWQGMQYLYSSLKGDCKFKELDNNRYEMQWTTAKTLLHDFLNNKDFVKHEPRG